MSDYDEPLDEGQEQEDDGSIELVILTEDEVARLITFANDNRDEEGRPPLELEEAQRLAVWANKAAVYALLVKLSIMGYCSLELDEDEQPEVHWIGDHKQRLIREIESGHGRRYRSTEEPEEDA